MIETIEWVACSERLRAELERERMRLAACGVVALANTPESAKKARDMHPDYRSASCDDVARMVDKQMALRAAVEALVPIVQRDRELIGECDEYRAERDAALARALESVTLGRAERSSLNDIGGRAKTLARAVRVSGEDVEERG